MLDKETVFAMIDNNSLDTCRIMLAMSAMDLAEELEALIESGDDPDSILASARVLVKQAYLREIN